MRPAFFVIALRAALGLTLGLLACVEPPAQPKKTESTRTAMMSDGATHVVNREEPWFEHPAQARPPNGKLAANTRVRILQDAGSYIKVQTADGTICFVSSEALTPLPGTASDKKP